MMIKNIVSKVNYYIKPIFDEDFKVFHKYKTNLEILYNGIQFIKIVYCGLIFILILFNII